MVSFLLIIPVLIIVLIVFIITGIRTDSNKGGKVVRRIQTLGIA